MKKLLLILLMLAFVNVNAVAAFDTDHKVQTKIETSKQNSVINAVVLIENSLNLDMDVKEHIAFKNGVEVLDIIQTRIADQTAALANNFNNKKENLILDKIKEHIPDFNLEEEAQRDTKRLIKECGPNTETYVLIKDNSRIRLITFKRTFPELNYNNGNASFSITESYF